MRTIVNVLFTATWALLAFVALRALVVLWRADRRVATASALAVAVAFALGATYPFALRAPSSGTGAAPPPVLTSAHSGVSVCPASPAAPAPARGHIDAVSSGRTVHLGGWIAAHDALASSACAIVDGKPVQTHMTIGIDRPDVGTAFNDQTMRGSGFDLSFDVAPGSHRVEIAAIDAQGHTERLAQVLTVVAK